MTVTHVPHDLIFRPTCTRKLYATNNINLKYPYLVVQNTVIGCNLGLFLILPLIDDLLRHQTWYTFIAVSAL